MTSQRRPAGEGGVVTFAFGSFPVVERLRCRVAQGCERGGKHGVLEPVAAATAADLGQRGAGLAGYRGQAGVGGQFRDDPAGGGLRRRGDVLSLRMAGIQARGASPDPAGRPPYRPQGQ